VTIVLALLLALQSGPQTAGPPTAADAWTAGGWRALRAGAVDEAESDFRRALQSNGAQALALLGSGTIAHLRGHDADARLHLTRALREQPSLTAASLLLGQILYAAGDLTGAIGVYEDASARAPGDARLAARLEAWRREAAVHETLSTRIATHFTILFEGPPDQPMAARVSELLESVYWQVGGALGVYPSDVLTVILYSKEQFRDITQSPSWASALYDGRIRVPVGGRIDEKALRRVLAHELTHAIVHSVAPRGVPVWLDEGLAQLMEQRTPIAMPEDAVVPSLGSLEKSFARLSPAEARAAYATSVAAAQALLDRAGPMVLVNLLSYLGNGLPFDEAFERAALMSYAQFQQTWR
jgi:tetratricopeptide (TPR) repeat protein